MAFLTEKEEQKPGLILFRRGDVGHRMWYCRMKMPKADRYKTVSLKTTDISAALFARYPVDGHLASSNGKADRSPPGLGSPFEEPFANRANWVIIAVGPFRLRNGR